MRNPSVCSPGERARVRAIFTDELIALLTDDVRPADAEVAGDWFLAYYGVGAFDELDEAWWRLKTRTAETVVRNATVLRDPRSMSREP